MLAPKRRHPLAQVLSGDPCATVVIDGLSPAARGYDQVCCKARGAATRFCTLHAIVIIMLKLRHILFRDCGGAGTFAVT
jgi:hypothetical protein